MAMSRIRPPITTTWPERIVTTKSISWTATTGICETTVLLEAIATAGSLTTSTTRVTVGRSAMLISSVCAIDRGLNGHDHADRHGPDLAVDVDLVVAVVLLDPLEEQAEEHLVLGDLEDRGLVLQDGDPRAREGPDRAEPLDEVGDHVEIAAVERDRHHVRAWHRSGVLNGGPATVVPSGAAMLRLSSTARQLIPELNSSVSETSRILASISTWRLIDSCSSAR